MPTPLSSRRRTTGFTLLELLVAIGCIAVLAALASPMINLVSRKTLSIRCINNLKQIGVGVNLYVQDHDFRMPILVNVLTKDKSAQTLDTVIFPMDDPDQSHPVLRCPADNRQLFEKSGTSYFWNQTVNDQPIGGLFSFMGGGNKAMIWLVADKEGFHESQVNKVNILFVNGRVGMELSFNTDSSRRR